MMGYYSPGKAPGTVEVRAMAEGAVVRKVTWRRRHLRWALRGDWHLEWA